MINIPTTYTYLLPLGIISFLTGALTSSAERTEVFRRAYIHISYLYYMVHITDLEEPNAQHLKFIFTNTQEIRLCITRIYLKYITPYTFFYKKTPCRSLIFDLWAGYQSIYLFVSLVFLFFIRFALVKLLTITTLHN